MEEGIFSFAADVDFDYIKELLGGDECWVETFSGAAVTNVEETEAVSLAGSSNQSQPGYLIDEIRCIVPRATTGPKVSVTDRLIRAISYIKHSTKDREVLIQIWGPVDLNGKRVLTTIDQPYIVDSSSTSLANYRSISMNFQFPADTNSDMVEGMPGRVFLGKVPEWTPDVRFFRIDEYARVGYAQNFNVSGTLALPVFDRSSQTQTCLGVIEVVTTTPTIKAELDSICEALQAVDLCSTVIKTTEKTKACTESYHAALPDILQVMKSACMSHNLPLAQTWMRCVQQGKQGCRHSMENYINCVSTLDSACYVFDPSVRGFHEACSEHHLLQGQGVAGKAFGTNDPCFCYDITSFCKTDYPLSHHARMFGLHAAVALRFRSVLTGATDFVLEFFLPVDCREPEEQKNILTSLSVVIQKTCKSLRVVTEDEAAPKWIDEQSCHTVSAFVEPTESMYDTSSVIQSDSRGSSFEDCNTITLEVLQRHFAGSLNDAAKSLGFCPTTANGEQGRHCWPSRKIQKVGRHSLEKLQSVTDSECSIIPKSLSVHRDHLNAGSLPAVSISPASSCSQSSSSNQSCSSGSQHRTSSWNSTRSEEAATLRWNDNDSGHKRMVYKDPKPLPRSLSHVTNTQRLPPFPKRTRKESDSTRVKVTYGDDKIRIRLQKNWKFKYLQNEVARRFNIDPSCGEMQLKYLDDDSEWVLLTCDADWEECIDVCMAYSSNTIKLSMYTPSHRHGSSSHQPKLSLI